MTPADAPRYLVGVLLHNRSGDRNALMPAATDFFNTLMDQLDRPRDRAFAHGSIPMCHPFKPRLRMVDGFALVGMAIDVLKARDACTEPGQDVRFARLALARNAVTQSQRRTIIHD